VSPTDKFRAVAYRVAAESIKRVKVELTLDNYEEELTKVGGKGGGGGAGGQRVIGEKVRTKIREFLLSGRVEKLSVLTDDPKALVMKELQEVWGIGPTMAEKLVKSGVTGVKDLVGKTQVGEVKLTQQIQTGVEHHTDIMKKIPRAEIAEIADEFLREARRVGGDRCILVVHEALSC
jgi:DNA polymerase/3'-5' exonuclease PolX